MQVCYNVTVYISCESCVCVYVRTHTHTHTLFPNTAPHSLSAY